MVDKEKKKNQHTWKNYGISQEERNRAVAKENVIDVNKKKSDSDEPSFTD